MLLLLIQNAACLDEQLIRQLLLMPCGKNHKATKILFIVMLVIGHFTYLIWIIVVFYFGSSAVRDYLSEKKPSTKDKKAK